MTDQQAAAAGERVIECDVCGRPLTNRKSRARGRGRECDRRLGAEPMLPGLLTVTVLDGLL